MMLPKAVRRCMKRRTLALTAVILGLVAVPALAANVNGDGTLVGTTGNDNIAAGNGNDTIWGLGGTDHISAGGGNDVIDANGKCPPGVKSGDYPHGLPTGQYCEHGQIPGSNDSIAAGNGSDTIYGGGGPNQISVGGGADTIYGGPIGDLIAAGNGNDTIFLGKGSGYKGSSVSVGSGTDVIHAQNGVSDTISCGGSKSTVYADKVDSISGCGHVIYTPDPTPRPNLSKSTHRLKHGKQAKHGTTNHDSKRGRT